MSKATGSPVVKYGLLALVVLAGIFLAMRLFGGGEEEGLGEVPAPKYDAVDPLDPQNVIGGGGPGGPSPVKK